MTYQAEVINSSAAALGYTLPGTIDRVSGVRYWSVTRSAVANLTSATATLYYGIGSTDGVSDPANLRVVKTNGAGTVWFDVGGTGTAAVTGTITSDPFNSFSLIALGNPNGGTNTLPIELTSFDAEAHGSRVHLQWITDSEVNNDYFDIERSKDGRSFSCENPWTGNQSVFNNLWLPGRKTVRRKIVLPVEAILAKTARDAVMVELCAQFPGYGFAKHKGYGSASHIEALKRLGPSPVHRRTFAPVRGMLDG